MFTFMHTRLPHSLLLILAAAAFLLFWKIDTRGLNEWDEARNGVNAYEMYRNGDPVNLYYAGALDTWNAKPPLVIWLICGSYALFGCNAFALRLPAALSILGAFLFAFLLLRKSRDKNLAGVTCAILLACKAIIGIHVGLTGDFDAPLLFFLTASAYYFRRYCWEGDGHAIYLAALCTGLAWYAKGPAAFIFLPGFFLAGCLKHKGINWLKDYRLWLAGLMLLLIAGSWIAIAMLWGKTAANDHYGAGNAIRTMLVEDTWHRMTASGFEDGQPANYFFFFGAVDVRLNLWNYLFYLTLAFGLYKAWRHKKTLLSYLRQSEEGMLLYVLCLILPLIALLTVATYKYDWYLAPAFWGIAYITAKGIRHAGARLKALKLLFFLLFSFTFVRHWMDIDHYAGTSASITGKAHAILSGSDTIVTVGFIRQDVLLQLKWMNKPVCTKSFSELTPSPNTIIVTDTSMLKSAPAGMSRSGINFNGYALEILQRQ